ncbi:hypothetical protein NMY3_01448 [Candidatus Nitrosocosmicus oleophilus]|uniref:Uncharacterized protein n=1 Tax=Candidatus Nitrosocosmicus oleophilus TaxID=1353260 RepID=A0A654M7V5_9ARCH|nr:hypothetical protein NMY3_01448 [Candidatus Nitrosocosmicus oleophilus]
MKTVLDLSKGVSTRLFPLQMFWFSCVNPNVVHFYLSEGKIIKVRLIEQIKQFIAIASTRHGLTDLILYFINDNR